MGNFFFIDCFDFFEAFERLDDSFDEIDVFLASVEPGLYHDDGHIEDENIEIEGEEGVDDVNSACVKEEEGQLEVEKCDEPLKIAEIVWLS